MAWFSIHVRTEDESDLSIFKIHHKIVYLILWKLEGGRMIKFRRLNYYYLTGDPHSTDRSLVVRVIFLGDRPILHGDGATILALCCNIEVRLQG